MLLEINDIDKSYETSSGFLKRHKISVLKGIDLHIDEGEVVGLVGESGSGKTTLARCIMGMIDPDRGSIVFEGVNPAELSRKQLKQWRHDIAIVYQNPFLSLNPRMKIHELVAEPIVTHERISRNDLLSRVTELLASVGLDDNYLERRVGQLSGGQAQRVAVARALALKPRFIILDEPTSALDVSVQAQVLNLLAELQKTRRYACLFITHDLDVVGYATDRVAVLERGAIVECGPTEQILDSPQHPYTKRLIDASPLI